MPRARGEKDYLSFTKGLFTEVNPLDTPDGTTADEQNMVLNLEDGTRKRRLGLDYYKPEYVYDVEEDDEGLFGIGEPVALYYWKSLQKFVYVTRENSLTDPSESVRSVIHICDKDNVFEFKVRIETPDLITPSFAEIRTRLVITLGTAPVLIQKSTNSYDVFVTELYVRDFSLIDDGLTAGENPSSLTLEHRYNLYNAGWWKERKLKSTDAVGDPIADYNTVQGNYPNNTQTPGLGDTVDGNTGLETFDPSTYDNIDLGSSLAPRGHYVYNIRFIDRSSRINAKGNDGAVSSTLTQIIEDGTSTGGGGTPGPGLPDWVDPPPPDGTLIP